MNKILLLFLLFLIFEKSFSQFDNTDFYNFRNALNHNPADLNKAEYLKKLAFYAIDMEVGFLDSISKHISDSLFENTNFKEVQKIISWKKEFIGKKVNLKFYDSFDNKKQLSSLKIDHKYILLDIWASWCVPCINDFDFIFEMKKRYKNLDIQFVFISIDEKKINWLSCINKFNISKHINLIDKDYEILNQLKIETIPKKILLDSSFNIIEIYSSKMLGKYNLDKKMQLLNNTMLSQ